MSRTKQKFYIYEDIPVVERRVWVVDAFNEEDAVQRFAGHEVANIRYAGIRTITNRDNEATLSAEKI